jgi:hypothetical protein
MDMHGSAFFIAGNTKDLACAESLGVEGGRLGGAIELKIGDDAT